ncbi:transcriptional regulator [Micromonospora tulbaghiae]|uniref:Transcriptional regulator n=1 Tax=Micromonospora tulbaghiae TaxID=479978 RepID=A0A386WTB8_9ACTN|nr:transcriptional regulator [Micromonospora tulbaghiae]NED49488.1 helix-turn-helix transcriptional regulator [Micromonospora aurantiaca]
MGGVTDIADTGPEAAPANGTARAVSAATGADPGATAAAADGGPALLTEPFDVPFPAPGIVRAVRRRADTSQRELARFARVHPSTIGRIEAGSLTPSLAMLSRIVGTAGFRLVVVDEAGRVLKPMRDRADLRDGAERRYPSHLDIVTDPEPGEWWADRYGLARPPETFYRNREVRDWLRRRSQWEVRVAKYRSVPPPPDPQRCGYRGGPPIRP